MPAFTDLTGQTFGRWTVVARAHHYVGWFWYCRCVCGQERPVSGRLLRQGKSASCGCARVPSDPQQRFWRQVRKTDGCWEWTGNRPKRKPGFAYGQFTLHDGSKISAHRYSYELAHGAIPPGLYVCHHCDNPPCVRPDHLFLGTDLDNKQDAHRKGRTLIGEKNHKAKLTVDDVLRIRALLKSGSGCVTIACQFGVTKAMILRIKHRVAWSHLPDVASF